MTPRRLLIALAVFALAVAAGAIVVAGWMSGGVGPSASTSSTAAASETATFIEVIDGDTIRTSAGTVRIIGIDTPERGQCGYDEAAAALAEVVAEGDAVALELPEGENDQDSYGRLIRYVTTAAGVDLGLLQLEAGNAVARYDSQDGYPEHPREAAYHSAQRASLGADGVVTVGCAGTG